MPETNDRGQKLATWKFPEHQARQRGKAWHVFFFLIGGAAMIWSLFTANFLFLMIILIAWTVIYVSGRRKPQMLQFTILEDGLLVNNKFYPFDDIEKFWVIYKPPHSKYVYFHFKTFWKPELVIPLERAQPTKVREILLDYLKEDISKEDENISETISREYKL